MKLALFNYDLPNKFIAQKPASPRDSAKLLVYDKKSKKTVHDTFLNLDKYLRKGDVLVFNDSKVFPARLFGNKESGGKAEFLFLKELANSQWEVLIGSRNPLIGTKYIFPNKLMAEIVAKIPGKSWLVKFNKSNSEIKKTLVKFGHMPLPPYIKNDSTEKKLQEQYQTIYAKKSGSAAAPTAGLHFTERLLKKLKKVGVQMEFVTLHVGLGTFNSVDTENIEDYEIHSERVEVSAKTMKNLMKAKKENKRIIAVGTTSVRTLEAIFANYPNTKSENIDREVKIFIYPGYKFKFVDAIITNFHLPKSSLLMLVSAFVGRKKILDLYEIAKSKNYRFFSFGDGMFLTTDQQTN
ncbi:MAG: tRNA preQ1(34) S-adenosylmethionine ribosyltransferase-isomerase QueA [Patescibacteria group bacterium]